MFLGTLIKVIIGLTQISPIERVSYYYYSYYYLQDVSKKRVEWMGYMEWMPCTKLAPHVAGRHFLAKIILCYQKPKFKMLVNLTFYGMQSYPRTDGNYLSKNDNNNPGCSNGE